MVMGYDPWDLGVQYHMVQSEPLMDKMGIPYDKDRKYLAKDGSKLAAPKNLINA